MIIIKLFHINFYYTRDNVLSGLVLHFYSALFFIYTYCNKKRKVMIHLSLILGRGEGRQERDSQGLYIC